MSLPLKSCQHLLVATSFSILLFACNTKSKPTKELIVKKWQISDVRSTATQQLGDSDLVRMKSTTLEFFADGKLTSSGTTRGSSTGSYTLSEDGKTLTTTSPFGKKSTNDVTTLTSNELVFRDGHNGLIFTAKPVKQ